MRVGIIGRGKVGRTLTAELQKAGVAASLYAGRRKRGFPGARHQVWILAVPDAQVERVAELLAPGLNRQHTALHCSGALGPLALAPCRARGVATATFHPLVSFVARRAPQSLTGCAFVAHGDPRAMQVARRLTRHLGAHLIAAQLAGPAYHAAAALLANGAAALAWSAVQTLMTLGLGQESAERALGQLLRTVADNIQTAGTPAALSGPVARGNLDTVDAHLQALAALDPALELDYRSVQPVVLRCAKAQGLDAESARAIAARLQTRPQRQK